MLEHISTSILELYDVSAGCNLNMGILGVAEFSFNRFADNFVMGLADVVSTRTTPKGGDVAGKKALLNVLRPAARCLVTRANFSLLQVHATTAVLHALE